MYYCYMVKEGLFDEEMQYAKDLGLFLFYDSTIDNFLDKDGNVVDINGKFVFVRTGVLQYKELINAVKEHKGISLTGYEDEHDKVMSWPSYAHPKRKLMMVKGREIVDSPDLVKTFFEADKVFFKTREKNYSGIEEIEKFYDKNSGFYKALVNHSDEYFIISDVIDISSDDYGPLEYRAFVINGIVYNISRRHDFLLGTIPKEVEISIKNIVQGLKDNQFPLNYVLDVFVSSDGVDILECNPIECSGTYLYNSVLPGVYDLLHTCPSASLPREQVLYGAKNHFSYTSQHSGESSILYSLSGGFAADIISYSMLGTESKGTFFHFFGVSNSSIFDSIASIKLDDGTPLLSDLDFSSLSSDGDLEQIQNKGFSRKKEKIDK